MRMLITECQMKPGLRHDILAGARGKRRRYDHNIHPHRSKKILANLVQRHQTTRVYQHLALMWNETHYGQSPQISTATPADSG